ncbi:alpha/beta hydrolase [Bacteroidota bacterium]
MKYRESRLKSTNGIKLYYRSWIPDDDSKGIMLIAHGLGEHSGAYEKLASYFCHEKIGVYALDLRGHGQSNGKRGHIKSFERYLNDFHVFYKNTIRKHKDKPVYFIGHDLGATLILNYVLTKNPKNSGIILSSPFFKFTKRLPESALYILKRLNYIIPIFPVKLNTVFWKLTNSKRTTSNRKKDKYYLNLVTIRLLNEIISWGQKALSNKHKFNCPVLLLHGTKNRVVSHKMSKEFAEHSSNISLKLLQGQNHELLNNNTRVYNIIHDWLPN